MLSREQRGIELVDHVLGDERRPLPRHDAPSGLVVAQQLLGFASERHWVRIAHANLRDAFPAMPKQSG